MFNYTDTYFCPRCEAETVHEVYDAGHERDSSNDRRACLDCGNTWFGFSDTYESEWES